jgi:hypothetical protein
MKIVLSSEYSSLKNNLDWERNEGQYILGCLWLVEEPSVCIHKSYAWATKIGVGPYPQREEATRGASAERLSSSLH